MVDTCDAPTHRAVPAERPVFVAVSSARECRAVVPFTGEANKFVSRKTEGKMQAIRAIPEV